MNRTFFLVIFATLSCGSIVAAQANRSASPTPEKADVPYLIHAGNLLETEQAEAVEDTSKKNELRYWVPGAASGVRTPLAAPEFLYLMENVDPKSLSLFRFEVKKGRREVFLRKKKKAVSLPYFTTVTPAGENLFKIRVDASLERGEYCLTPESANAVYCFSVY